MIDLLQWPALLLSIAGAWCVGGQTPRARRLGFWLFLVSNLCWAGWGIGAGAAAVVIAQLVFMVTSVRGIRSNGADLTIAEIELPPPGEGGVVNIRGPALVRWRGGHQPDPHHDYPPGTLPPPPVGGSGKT